MQIIEFDHLSQINEVLMLRNIIQSEGGFGEGTTRQPKAGDENE